MKLVTPEKTEKVEKSVFLAGTIDDGKSFDWQKEVVNEIDKRGLDLTIFNPRNDKWNEDATAIDICRQIEWEQNHLDKADIIVMKLSDDSKSPISLLELGLYAASGKLAVFCTDKFYRWHNVWMTCNKYKIPLYRDLSTKAIVDVIQEMAR